MSSFRAELIIGLLVCATAASAQPVRAAQPPSPAPRPTPVPASPVAPVRAKPPLDALALALPTLDEETRKGLAVQVALDRAGFSPGEIDGRPGLNTARALDAFTAARGNTDLGDAYLNPVTRYVITPEDAAGPFIDRLPGDMMEQATLPALGYTSIVELLGERFHINPKLLQRLNPGVTFAAGTEIVVPNVEPFVVPHPAPPADSKQKPTPAAAQRPAVTVVVSEATKSLQVKDAAGAVLLHAPVTVGSENDPLPLGEWKVNGVGELPVFHYNPELFWDADPSHAKAKVPPGPNNPVGVAWIDLSKEHYGIHGTPEPSRIGHTESHGCIRLTNWDVLRVAALVAPGTKVLLQ